MLRRALIAATAAVGLLVSGCGGAPQTAPVAPSATAAPYDVVPADFVQIRRLMATQARAVLHHDRAAYLATVAPSYRRQAGVLFANLARLDITHLSYSVDTEGLVPAEVPGGHPTLAPETFEHLQLAGSMLEPIGNIVSATFARIDGHWLLADEREPKSTEELGSPQSRPWFGGPISVARRGTLTAITDRGSAVSAARLADTMAADLRSDADLLGVSVRAPLLVDGTSHGASMVMNTLTGEHAGASAYPVYAVRGAGVEVTGLAGEVIQADTQNVGQLLTDRQTERHELTHVLLMRYLGVCPTWVNEGIAEYVGSYPDEVTFSEEDAGRRALLAHPHVIPVSGVFGLHSRFDYSIAHAAVRWLVERYGMPRFVELLHTFARDDAGESPDVVEDKVLRSVYGVSMREVTAGAWSELARVP